MGTDFSDAVRRAVECVPPGRVATYGAIAEVAGHPGAARAVGGVLRSLPASADVPWWRVLGAGGRITIPRHHHHDRLQRALLEDEGVRLDGAGTVDLSRYGWPAPGDARDAGAPDGGTDRASVGRREPDRNDNPNADRR